MKLNYFRKNTCYILLLFYLQVNALAFMYISHLSLTNQRIRNALRVGDSKTVSEAIHFLLKNDEEKAYCLAKWFRKVSNGARINSAITENLAIMRMWLLGNVDIESIGEDGEPVFVLTYTGSEIVKRLPKIKHFKALLDVYKNDICY